MQDILIAVVFAALIIWSTKTMSDAFDHLTASVDAAVAKLTAPLPAAGTSDADISALADKLDAALAAGPAPTV